jgi:hypothetical protein
MTTLNARYYMKGNLQTASRLQMMLSQGCILSPIIFLLVLDNVMRKTLGNRKKGIQWGMKDRLEDLDFADDICLL